MQYFCGFEFFQHESPIDASTMTRWRKRIGSEGLEEMLKACVEVALDTGTAKSSSLERITVDNTVQPKAIAHPTDCRLYLKAIQILVRQAKRHGVVLRQSHTRLAKAATVRVGRYAHALQFRRMRRELKRFAPISVTCSAISAARSPACRTRSQVRPAARAGRAAAFPEAEGQEQALFAACARISKGKAHTPYEFGCRIATRNREGLVLAAKSFEATCMMATRSQRRSIRRCVDPDRIYVDKGYLCGSGSVMVAGHDLHLHIRRKWGENFSRSHNPANARR